MARVALVTGGNRGIGLEVVRQLLGRGLEVVLASRDRRAGEEAARELVREGPALRVEELDVGSDSSVRGCASRLEGDGLIVDVLVNNAGVYPGGDLLADSPDALAEAVNVNFFGAVRTARAWMPGMLRRGYGRIVNLSTGYGSFGEGLGGPPAYAVSKAALNALTVRLAAAARGDVKVNAVCPGWVRTRMGGEAAPRSVRKGAEGVVWLATLDAAGPNGGFFRDRRPVPW
jgi:NAD(P)-dependent dehydrogenase (short-subunit alcohol dehydrogenase family)